MDRIIVTFRQSHWATPRERFGKVSRLDGKSIPQLGRAKRPAEPGRRLESGSAQRGRFTLPFPATARPVPIRLRGAGGFRCSGVSSERRILQRSSERHSDEMPLQGEGAP